MLKREGGSERVWPARSAVPRLKAVLQPRSWGVRWFDGVGLRSSFGCCLDEPVDLGPERQPYFVQFVSPNAGKAFRSGTQSAIRNPQSEIAVFSSFRGIPRLRHRGTDYEGPWRRRSNPRGRDASSTFVQFVSPNPGKAFRSGHPIGNPKSPCSVRFAENGFSLCRAARCTAITHQP